MLGKKVEPKSSQTTYVEGPKPKQTYANSEESRHDHNLVRAIIFHETANGTKGVGKTHNNLCGIKRKGRFERYATRKESWDDCMSVYMRLYKGKTIEQMAQRWTTTQRAEWIRNVRSFYERFEKEA